jgi:hypothetical protein
MRIAPLKPRPQYARPVAGKVDEDQQRHGAEDGEQRSLRAAADGEGDRRRNRQHDGRAPGPPQRVELGVAGAHS